MRRAAAGLLLVLLAAAAGTAGAAARPLDTAVLDGAVFSGPDAAAGFDRTKALGATHVRLVLDWASVSPGGRTKPPDFAAADPNAPAYSWSAFDAQLRLAFARGLTPIVVVAGAPSWAQERERLERRRYRTARYDGPVFPNPVEFGTFARAAATRYSGSFRDLPRVRYWQAWSEPNFNGFLSPQFDGDDAVTPEWYRDMLNRFAEAVRDVRSDNVVVAGGLSPFTHNTDFIVSVAPLRFMRELLCMSNGTRPRPTCNAVTDFDVWATNPYTTGGPTHQAFRPDDVSLGDLPEMHRLLMAAKAAGRIRSRGEPRFWVTEFSWDTAPPDPGGVPAQLHARWVAEALYRMWAARVSLVTWFTLRDNHTGPHQSGLFFRGATFAADRPKPAAQAFRFPFVALPQQRLVLVWGRTPAGQRGTVVVERRFKGGWAQAATLRTDRYGIFTRRVRRFGHDGSYRARLLGSNELSRPFALQGVRDKLYYPFGSDH